ncbi:MAG TPA: TonB-dependent receptor, partial [Candidatus Saccharimonadia bacterium]|nr:TonB-dependent receptor [Candidatus Saccharimonadia bacterium]
SAASGRPISALGVGNPFDVRNFHSFYICVQNCTATTPVAQRVYELRGRGNEGRTPSTYEFGASVTYLHSFGSADLRVKLAVYNLFDQQRTIEVQENQQTAITATLNPEYGLPLGFQQPRYAQLTVTLEF